MFSAHTWIVRFCFLFIALVLTLKMDAISSLDEKAKATFPEFVIRTFPNPRAKDNTILAPFGLRNLLLAASVVAKRKTKAQLETMLLSETAENILKLSAKRGDEVKMRLFVNKELNVTECVRQRFSEIIEYVEIKRAKKRMEAYIRGKTQGIVRRTGTANFDSKTSYVTMLYDEYLDLKWTEPFEAIIPAKSTIGGVYVSRDVMRLNDEFLYGNLTDLGVEAVELPFENGAKLLMLQPYNIKDLGEKFRGLKEKLKTVDFRDISQRLSNKKLSLHFPKLRALKMHRNTLAEVAKKMHIQKPFRKNDADFGKLHPCGEDSYIQQINTYAVMNTDNASLRIGAVLDMNVRLTNPITPQMMLISGEEDEDEDGDGNEDGDTDEDGDGNEEVTTSEPDSDTEDSNYPILVMKRFMWALINNDYVQFVGTMVKYHNNPDED